MEPPAEIRAAGREALALATRLLRRARLADPEGGLWEAADVQWWWRRPRRSDELEQLFWVDAEGPVAGVLLTDWGRAWQCDVVAVRGASSPAAVWPRAAEAIAAAGAEPVEVPARDDDAALVELLRANGFAAGDRSTIAWLEAADRPPVAGLPDGFALVDRADGPGGPHPMRRRNGGHVEARLRLCPLYDPALDLAVEAPDGRVAGYALFWHDPVTQVGLVEPMRVEDEFQRRGLGRALLTAGLDRLAALGARRLKIGWSTAGAGALYRGCGFRPAATTTWYAAPPRSVRMER